MFFGLYRWFVWPLLSGAFHLLGRFNSKIALGLELRSRSNGRSPWVKLLPPQPPTVWIHAASGEFEYAKPVITRLKKARPEVKIVVTFFSPTYADNIRKFSGVDWVVPLPWDTRWALREFLDSYRPFALLIARTDVWPEMAKQAHERGMKSVLFSATLTQGSGRTRGLGKWATRKTLDCLDEIWAVTEDDAAVFRSLGLSRASVSVHGDSRYDQVLARLASPKPLREFEVGRPWFVCGSTWSEDEDVLIPALVNARDVCGCLVPHEPTPEHLAELEAKLLKAGLKPVRYSEMDASHRLLEEGTCLVVDQVGILAELYSRAQWAFVGGSFRKTVHSVMEPLAAGCLTLVGPLHTNNREAIAFQSSGAVQVVRSSQEISAALRQPLHDPAFIRGEVLARTGSSDALVEWVTQQL